MFHLLVLRGSVINGNSIKRNIMTDFATAKNKRDPPCYLKSHSVITRLKQRNCDMEPATYRIERGTTDRHGIGRITRTYFGGEKKSRIAYHSLSSTISVCLSNAIMSITAEKGG